MTYRWAVTRAEAIGPCPKAYRGEAHIWVTARDPARAERGLWEILPVSFYAETADAAEAKARAFMADMLAKARTNNAKTTKGRKFEFDVAPELFEAMGAVAEALVENSEIRDADDAADQRGYRLRSMSPAGDLSEEDET